MFPTLLSKTGLIQLLSNMNYQANFLYNTIGINAEQAKFTTATGDLIDKLMEEENVTYRTVFNMVSEIIPSDLRVDPGYKPISNGEPWFFDDFISTDIQVKNQFKQTDRNRFGCIEATPIIAPSSGPQLEAVQLERLPTNEPSKEEITRQTTASGKQSELSNLDNYDLNDRTEHNSLESSQEFLNYVDKMSVSSSESQFHDDHDDHGDDHGDLYEGFPPEFM